MNTHTKHMIYCISAKQARLIKQNKTKQNINSEFCASGYVAGEYAGMK